MQFLVLCLIWAGIWQCSQWLREWVLWFQKRVNRRIELELDKIEGKTPLAKREQASKFKVN